MHEVYVHIVKIYFLAYRPYLELENKIIKSSIRLISAMIKLTSILCKGTVLSNHCLSPMEEFAGPIPASGRLGDTHGNNLLAKGPMSKNVQLHDLFDILQNSEHNGFIF